MMVLTDGSPEEQSLVYRENSMGDSTQPWGAPVLTVRGCNKCGPSLTYCLLLVRKPVIHKQVRGWMFRWVSLLWRRSGMMMLKAEL